MHVALIVDEERLVHEQPTLNRLAIGLIGEGIQLTRIVPESIDSTAIGQGEQRMALAARIDAPLRVLPWMRGERVARLAEAMEKSPPDVLYAIGEQAWPLGRDLARGLDRPLVLDLWAAEQIRRVARSRGLQAVAGYIVPTPSFATALRARVDPGLVCLVPTGVALPPTTRQVLAEPDRSVALAVIGGGRDVPAYRALLSGLSRVVREMPQVHVFIELEGPNEHEIWRHARRLELLEHISAITGVSQHRALITRCDILLMPERYGELRSIMLEAMMVGMPIVAGDDPFLDMLVDEKSASIVREIDADEWARKLTRLVTDPDAARALGQRAREHVAAQHRSSVHVAALIATFERITSGGAYPFEADAPGP